MRKNQGITLIALVITIIVLLILAGISIVTLTGENGVLKKATIAQEETKKAEYKEVLELIGNGIRPEKVLEQLDTKTFMDRYEEKIREKTKKGESLEEANIERISDSIIRVSTKEGYVYQITEDEVKYLGKYGENTPPDLQETDIDFILEPEGYTNQDITVEIRPKINIEGYTLQYSTDGSIWIKYTEKIIMKENGTIYARLVNEIGETGSVATKIIDTIEKDLPNEAIIVFNKSSVSIGEQLTAKVTQSDVGSSGLDITNCKYIFTTNGTEIGTNPSSYTGGKFTDEVQTLTLDTNQLGTYYLHVLTVDKVGNKRETISKAVKIVDTAIPNDATITFDKTFVPVGETITATVTQSDGQSGVDIANCKYILKTTITPLGTNDVSKYTGGGFTKETQDKIALNCLSAGNYYLHVLTVDKAGNKKETISQKIRFYQTTYYLQGSNTYESVTGGYTSKGVAPRSSGRNDFAYGTTSAWAKGNYYIGACRADSITVASTVKPINLNSIDTLYCDYLLYDDGAEKCRYGFGISASPCSATWDFGRCVEKITTTTTKMSSFETVSLDVSNIIGSYYIRLYCQRVYTRGTDSDGSTWHTCYLGFKNIYGR